MENVELVSITPNAMELLKQVVAVCYQVRRWNVVKVQPGTYRAVRKHKFIVTMEEQDVNEFRYRVLAEERADILNHKDGKKEK